MPNKKPREAWKLVPTIRYDVTGIINEPTPLHSYDRDSALCAKYATTDDSATEITISLLAHKRYCIIQHRPSTH